MWLNKSKVELIKIVASPSVVASWITLSISFETLASLVDTFPSTSASEEPLSPSHTLLTGSCPESDDLFQVNIIQCQEWLLCRRELVPGVKRVKDASLTTQLVKSTIMDFHNNCCQIGKFTSPSVQVRNGQQYSVSNLGLSKSPSGQLQHLVRLLLGLPLGVLSLRVHLLLIIAEFAQFIDCGGDGVTDVGVALKAIDRLSDIIKAKSTAKAVIGVADNDRDFPQLFQMILSNWPKRTSDPLIDGIDNSS